MFTKTRLSLAVLAALGLSCASAFAMTNSMPADPDKVQSMDITHPSGSQAGPVARRGGTLPEDDNPICDDPAGDNTPCVIGRRGGTLPEDDDPICDDPAGDNTPCVIGRRGGTLPEDDDGFDDNGVDPLPHASAPDRGVLVASKGRGKDGTKPEDDGVDLDDGCDNNGIDGVCV